MAKDENQPLLNVVNATEQHDDSRWTKCRIYVVLLFTAFNYIGIYFYYYPRNEWLQGKIQREYFPNQTFSLNKVCGEVNKSDPNYDKHAKVQQVTASWQMYLTMGSKGMCVFTSFIYAAYTDSYGRRFLFILSSFSMFLLSSLIAAVIYFDAHPIYIVAAETLYGLFGTHYGFEAASFMYLADLTLPGTQRSMSMFLLAASKTLGEAMGAFAVGYNIKGVGFFYPVLTSASLQLILFILVILTIRESHKKERRLPLPPVLELIKRPFAFYTSSDFKHSRCLFLLLLFAFAFADMTVTHRKSIETLYQLGLPFCWNPVKIALFATAGCLGQNVIGLGFFRLVQRCFTDIKISLIAALTNAGSFVTEGLASTSLVLYLSTVPAILNTLPSPLIRSTMSAMTSERQQGALFASIIMVQAFCSFLGGITDNSVYAATLEVFDGFIFVMLAGYCGVTILLLSIFSCISKRKNVKPQTIQVEET